MLNSKYIEEFESLVQDIMHKQNARGLALAAVDKKGEILYQKFLGYRDAERKLEIDEDTIFGLASITKSFTSICILQLAEKGLLSLDDPVNRYIPELTCKNQKETLRIRHLLSHAGGYFPLRRTCIQDVAARLGLNQEKDGDFALSEALALEGTKLVADQMDAMEQMLGLPGERMSYCNDGFGLLSEIVRRVGDQPSFAEYVTEHICKPLGMTRSNGEYLKAMQDENASVLYTDTKDESFADHDYCRSAFVLGGTGVMKSTIADMCKYLAMFLNEGCEAYGVAEACAKVETCEANKRILSARMIKEMSRPRMENGPFSWYGYGLSMNILDDLEVWGHGGSLPGVSSYMAWSKELEAGVIVLCNTENVSVNVIAEGLLRVLNEYEAKVPARIYRGRPWSRAQMQEASGTYLMGEDADRDTLILQAGNNHEMTLLVNGKKSNAVPISPTRLRVPGTYRDSFIEIIRDENGQVFAARYGSRTYPKL